ncbi:hypothetical protein EAF00_000525 [Botryotinia globosa]|nr:hypothetical protein EAF00_000525 [Botryotinia globosa]
MIVEWAQRGQLCQAKSSKSGRTRRLRVEKKRDYIANSIWLLHLEYSPIEVSVKGLLAIYQLVIPFFSLSQHFSQICVSDLILVNEDGEVVIGDEPINAAAFAIHSEVHKARPDVHAACHAHSVYGKAYSAFGLPLDMITQDSRRFYKSHSVYDNFGGIVLDREEGVRIAKSLGNGKACNLQNQGLLAVLVDAAASGSGKLKKIIGDEEAAFTYDQVGGPEKGWLAFQGYYDEIMAKTGGNFLK